MTPVEHLRMCAAICRRAAAHIRFHHLVRPRPDLIWGDATLILTDDCAEPFSLAADLIESVAEMDDGLERIRSVAELQLAGTEEGRVSAWHWVLVILGEPEPADVFLPPSLHRPAGRA
jgi:hypothetical protein